MFMLGIFWRTKIKLWVDVSVDKHGRVVDIWCCVRDFDSIIVEEEKKGVGAYLASGVGNEDMRVFNLFIKVLILIDLPLSRQKFTWYLPS